MSVKKNRLNQKVKEHLKQSPIKVSMMKVDEKDVKSGFEFIDSGDSFGKVLLDVLECLDLGAQKKEVFRSRIKNVS